jgi:hypothetical protein
MQRAMEQSESHSTHWSQGPDMKRDATAPSAAGEVVRERWKLAFVLWNPSTFSLVRGSSFFFCIT